MVIEKLPLSSAVVVAIIVSPPISKLRVLPASSVPSIVGVASTIFPASSGSKSSTVVLIVGFSSVASIVID